MDGSSYLNSLLNVLTPTTHPMPERALSGREDFLVEYHGEYGGGSDGQYVALSPPLFETPPFFQGPLASKMQDSQTYYVFVTLTLTLTITLGLSEQYLFVPPH